MRSIRKYELHGKQFTAIYKDGYLSNRANFMGSAMKYIEDNKKYVDNMPKPIYDYIYEGYASNNDLISFVYRIAQIKFKLMKSGKKYNKLTTDFDKSMYDMMSDFQDYELPPVLSIDFDNYYMRLIAW